MAEWIEEKIDKTQINKGQQYNNGDGLSAEDLNAIVKGLLYAQEKTSDSQYVRIDDDIDNADKFVDYLNNYNINLTDFKNQTVCFESYSETYYYDYFVFLTNYDNEAILLCDGGVFNISYSINGYKKSNIVQKVTGDLANLQTMDKDNLVSAINYTYEATLFNSRNIDTINQTIGSKSNLQTTDKTNLVNAINEINTNTKANTNDINKLGLSLTDLKEALYGYVLDVASVDIENVIPSQVNGYNLVDNVRGLVKSINGNTIKVSGNNLISYVSTTLNSTNSVGDTIATITANGSVININRTASSGSNTQNNTIQLSKTLSANTQYTFKLFTPFEDTENFAIVFMDANGQTLFQLNNSTNKQTYTPSSDITQVRVLTTSGTYTKDIKIMCIEGAVEPSEFESADSVLKSVEYEGLVVKGANLLNIPNVTSTTTEGMTYSITGGEVSISGTPTGNYKTCYSKMITDIMSPNATYTLNSNSNCICYVQISIINMDDTTTRYYSEGTTPRTFTLPSQYKGVWFNIQNGTTVSLITNGRVKPMLVKGSTAPTTFRPYKEPITLLPFNTTLRGVGTAKDKIVITENKNGLYTATKISNVGSVDLGTLSFTFDSISTKQWWNVNIPNLKTGTSNILHENLITYDYSTFVSDINIIGLASVSSITNRVIIRNNSTIDTPTGKLVYELAEPTTEVLSTTLTESDVMTILELGGSVEVINSNSEFVNGSTTMEMVYKLINATTTSEVLSNE